ncbi:hypothetical protein A0H81_05332 [Grifola frondosa]|uniref:Uncharacterized protein n=1 Tax=Grifola frondosa TaxID=5627 RepID=A0A1C7MD72_GRIFR|nr:hypothetical protein A0H81_05332 [Grifola frondosa]
MRTSNSSRKSTAPSRRSAAPPANLLLLFLLLPNLLLLLALMQISTTSKPSCSCACACASCGAPAPAPVQYDFPIVPLCTPRRVRPRVPLMVFGYALSIDDILAYGERNGLIDDSGLLNLIFVIERKICAKMPDGKRFISNVRKSAEVLATCFVIASNRNSRHLKGVNDRELIKLMQEILGTESLPQWYEVCPI